MKECNRCLINAKLAKFLWLKCSKHGSIGLHNRLCNSWFPNCAAVSNSCIHLRQFDRSHDGIALSDREVHSISCANLVAIDAVFSCQLKQEWGLLCLCRTFLIVTVEIFILTKPVLAPLAVCYTPFRFGRKINSCLIPHLKFLCSFKEVIIGV